MGITNYKIDKIEAEVKERATENIDIKESFAITDVKKKNAQMLDVGWSFNVDYKGLGKAGISGTLTYFTDKLEGKYEEKEVKGKKVLALKEDALKDVSNFILRRGIIEMVILSKTLQVPAPIQLPSVKVETKA
jgi:hypothetical protein